MYTMINAIGTRYLLGRQAIIVVIGIVIAEIFYKFHSFTLECIAFLATWYVLDILANKLLGTDTENG